MFIYLTDSGSKGSPTPVEWDLIILYCISLISFYSTGTSEKNPNPAFTPEYLMSLFEVTSSNNFLAYLMFS